MKQKYIHGGWSHIFHPGGPALDLRIAYDREKGKLVAMQIKCNHAWLQPSPAEMEDVEDSIKSANDEAIEHPEAWGLEASDMLPPWARGHHVQAA